MQLRRQKCDTGVTPPAPVDCVNQGTITGPQWALGGDTWVVGVPIPDTVVLPEFNTLNPDHGKFEGPCGMYEPGCGFANLKFAYGHDEYMYQVGACVPHHRATTSLGARAAADVCRATSPRGAGTVCCV